MIWLAVGALALLPVMCTNDDSSPTDCSRRNLPQYQDERGDWTCKPRH